MKKMPSSVILVCLFLLCIFFPSCEDSSKKENEIFRSYLTDATIERIVFALRHGEGTASRKIKSEQGFYMTCMLSEVAFENGDDIPEQIAGETTSLYFMDYGQDGWSLKLLTREYAYTIARDFSLNASRKYSVTIRSARKE